MKNNNTDNDVKSYKWVKLKNDPPKNSVLYVLDPETGDVELFITDKNGNPKPVKTEASVNIGDYVKTNSNNIIKVEQNKIFVKKTIAGDSFINIEETNTNYILTLNKGTIEFITNKQNNLTPDGTGTKYPTVDAINEVVGVINERIDDIELTPGADGKSAYELAVEEGFIGTLDEWLDSLQGDDGIDGKSAYQIWLDEGNTGTVEDFLESLIGKDGDKGDAFTYDDFTDSQLEALKGEDGVDGKSAYELWLDQGNTGTIQDFLTSLEGDDGLSAYEIALINGFVGTEVQWLQSLIGQQGLSAYQIWLQQGNVGSVQDFLDSLIGEDGYTPIKNIDYFDGANGDSAYQIWLDLGNVGTPQDFINSLQGDDGQAGSVVTIGTNNNWFIDNVDTGVKAVGEDGLDGYTPIKGIDYFDGTDGYTPQKGIDYFDGIDGTDGKDGNGWFGGSSNPASGLGQIGDWYVNNTTWDVFEKTTSGVWTLRGNIKGGDGADGISGTISLVTASIGNSTGVPSVVVTLGGTPTNRTINLDFNNLKGDKGDKGEDGKGVRIVGTLPNPGLLPTPPLNDDDAYLIDGDLWVWDSINNTWVNVGNIQGPAGPPNILTIGTVTTGTPGSSASASITGTSPSQILNLVIPEGLPGSNAPTYTGSNGIDVTSTVISPIYGNTVGTIAEGNDPRFHNAVTIGLANGLSLNNQILSLTIANGTTTGALSSTDWNNFNNKTSANNGNISYTGTGSIIGGGVSSANQSGNTAYTFDLSTQTKSDINLGVTANGWGNHALMGYLTSANLVGYATQTWVSTNFAQLAHTHITGHITSLTGYTIGTNTPLVASDTLNQALGKLQAQLDNKGTVTSITAGTGLSGGTITTSGTIALNTSTIASLNLANSALQSGDNISELINDVGYLTLPVLAGYVPVSRTLTINGVTYDLTSNRSWNIPLANDGNITYTGIGSITGGGTSTANQSGNTNYSFDLTAQTKTDIGLGVSAYNSLGNYVNRAGDIMSGVLRMINPSGDSYINYVSGGSDSNIGYNGTLFGSGGGGIFNVINGDAVMIIADNGHTAIGYGLYKSNYMLDVNGIINTASNGNSPQWNEAFLWGNHALQGYLKANALIGYATENWVNNNFIPQTHPSFGISNSDISNWNAKQNQLTNGLHTTLSSNQINVAFDVNTYVKDKSNNDRLLFGITSSTDVVIKGAVSNGDFKVKDSTDADMFRIIGSSKVPQFPQLPAPQTIDGNIAIFDTGNSLWKHNTKISDLVTLSDLTPLLNGKANVNGNNLTNIANWQSALGINTSWNLQQVTNNGASTTNVIDVNGLKIGFNSSNLYNLIDSAIDVGFTKTNYNEAQRVLTGGLLASDNYADAILIPVNGIYSKGTIATGSHGTSGDWYQGYLNSQTAVNLTWEQTLTNNPIAYSLPIFQRNAGGKFILKDNINGITDNYFSWQDLSGGERAYQGFGSGSNEDFTFYLRDNGVNRFQWYLGNIAMYLDQNYLTVNRTISTASHGTSANWWSAYATSLMNRGTAFVSNIDANNISIHSEMYAVETANGTGNTNFPDGRNQSYGTFIRNNTNTFTTDFFNLNDSDMYFRTFFAGNQSTGTWRKIWDNVNLINPATETWVGSQGYTNTTIGANNTGFTSGQINFLGAGGIAIGKSGNNITISYSGGGGGGITNISTDDPNMPGPTSSNMPIVFNSHVAYGKPETDINDEEVGNGQIQVESGDVVRFHHSFDNVMTFVEDAGKQIDIDTNEIRKHICNVVFTPAPGTGGTVTFTAGVYTGDQINITVPRGEPINLQPQGGINLISSSGQEIYTHANLIWDAKLDSWVLVSYE